MKSFFLGAAMACLFNLTFTVFLNIIERTADAPCSALAASQGLETAHVRNQNGFCEVKVYGQGWTDLEAYVASKSEVSQ